MLPITLLEQEAQRRAAITVAASTATRPGPQDRLEALIALLGREDDGRDELVPLRRAVPRAAASRVRGDEPDIRLGGGAEGDLVGVLEGRILPDELAAGGAGGDEVEGDDGDEVVADGRAGAAGEVEDLAVVRVGGVAPFEDVDDTRAEGGAGAGGEVYGGGIWFGGWGGVGGCKIEKRGENECSCWAHGRQFACE